MMSASIFDLFRHFLLFSVSNAAFQQRQNIPIDTFVCLGVDHSQTDGDKRRGNDSNVQGL